MVSGSQSTSDANVQEERKETETVRPPAPTRNWRIPLILVGLPLVLFVCYTKLVFAGLINAEALDFAQLGRNISAGRGMTTYILHPLALTHGANLLRQPDVTHGPLFPFLLALAFGALGARDAVASYVSGLFYLLTIPLLYALGLRVFNRNVGLLAAVAFACSNTVLQYAVSGLHITLYTFLITALFLALYNLSAGKVGQAEALDAPLSTKLLLLIGALTGMLYLTDPIFVWIVPVVFAAVLMICGPQRRAAAFKFVLPLGILMLPWMARNFQVAGNPLFGLRGTELWMYTSGHFPGRLGYALYADDFPRGGYLLPAVGKKVLLGLNTVVYALPQIPGAWILAFLMPCLLFGYTSRSATILRGAVMFSALALLGGMLVFQVEMPLFTCLVPTMLIFSIAYLTHLVRQAELSPNAAGLVATLFGITLLYPLGSQMFLEEKIYEMPEVVAAKGLSKMVQAQDGVISDYPEAIAWYADRPAVLIPASDDRLADVRSQFPAARWLFLTPQTRSKSASWQALYDQYAHWNTLYAQAQMRKEDIPPALQVSATNQSLYKALTGFTSVAPVQNASLSTVIAVLPETKLSMGSEPARQSAP